MTTAHYQMSGAAACNRRLTERMTQSTLHLSENDDEETNDAHLLSSSNGSSSCGSGSKVVTSTVVTGPDASSALRNGIS